MKLPIFAALAATIALSACTDANWSHTMSFIGLDESGKAAPKARPVARTRPVPAVPAQTAQAAGPNEFCTSVARQDAESNEFDAATQQGVFVRSYQQCVTIFGNTQAQ